VQPPATVAVVLGWTKRDPAWGRYLGLDDGLLQVAPAS
jgi:hypothetical protein